MDKINQESLDVNAASHEVLQVDDFKAWREFVKDLKRQWKYLWWSRIDDEIRAEGIASMDFPKLFVEKGTVIIATRDYKPPDFHEILKRHMPPAIAEQANTTPTIGGIRKFIKEMIRRQRSSRVMLSQKPQKPRKHKYQQRKHGGRGWLHFVPEWETMKKRVEKKR